MYRNYLGENSQDNSAKMDQQLDLKKYTKMVDIFLGSFMNLTELLKPLTQYYYVKSKTLKSA